MDRGHGIDGVGEDDATQLTTANYNLPGTYTSGPMRLERGELS